MSPDLAVASAYSAMLCDARPEHPYAVYNGFVVHHAGGPWFASYPDGGPLPSVRDFAAGWYLRTFASDYEVQRWIAEQPRLRRYCRICFPTDRHTDE